VLGMLDRLRDAIGHGRCGSSNWLTDCVTPVGSKMSRLKMQRVGQ
jgi:hypothetical protein